MPRKLGISAYYRNNHTTYINTIIIELINNEDINLESLLEKAVQETLIDHLDTDTIDSLIITLGKKLELNNANYIDFFIEQHNSEREYHQDIAIGRWDFFNVENRKTYLENFNSIDTKNEFGTKLIEMI
ncbi:hypothetical protein FHR92_004982 [Fontibacillus solani]|uniref:Uncharacterized protein n=1 Tax=Fontibacillus solani TaxID=1572857 RepID=A0A7W3SY98_9BACL|nr:hypothetical protein [Fontibacillus solani]MBA9088466.1 hypothetical protein [Fontibacillus solani]